MQQSPAHLIHVINAVMLFQITFHLENNPVRQQGIFGLNTRRCSTVVPASLKSLMSPSLKVDLNSEEVLKGEEPQVFLRASSHTGCI